MASDPSIVLKERAQSDYDPPAQTSEFSDPPDLSGALPHAERPTISAIKFSQIPGVMEHTIVPYLLKAGLIYNSYIGLVTLAGTGSPSSYLELALVTEDGARGVDLVRHLMDLLEREHEVDALDDWIVQISVRDPKDPSTENFMKNAKTTWALLNEL